MEMEMEMEMEGEGLKTRSFRYEDYNNRRAFLRSYPLQWEDEEEEEEEGEEAAVSSSSKSKAPLLAKTRLVAVFRWGEGKLLLLRRLKKKVAFYLVACHPFRFKSSAKLLITA
ncbi:hypothetical protein ACMD2_10132 [Ananas comosus]|uniref:Uncharacterized protein n=1 Tax=Ananas comosus TaxID=4615 RepID=A0A199VA10_ANACO|nr:hypothetical protein ACMD2_10132 [Ananas comosus]